jgi:hypothetical protein
MPRQPLPRKYREGEWILGPDALSRRPVLASIIGRCLALWSDADLQMAVLLSILMKANADAAVAVYQILRRSAPRYASLTAAAEVTLAPFPKDLEL